MDGKSRFVSRFVTKCSKWDEKEKVLSKSTHLIRLLDVKD